MKITGNYTALITPFKRNGNVDFDKLSELIDFQLNCGTDGLVVLGATAEAHLLDSYEKHKIMQLAVKKVCKSIPVIAGLTATGTEDAIAEAHARFIDGADALLACTPSYIKPTQSGLLQHFTKLADRSFIPIIIYNNPSRTGVNIDFQTIKQLALHRNIIGIKEASSDFGHICKASSITNDAFCLICGNDEFLLPFLSVGASACISVLGNIMPDLMHDIIEKYNTHPSEAFKIYKHYYPIIEALSLAPNPVGIKYIMQKLDMLKAKVRQPLCLPDRKTKARINQNLQSLLQI